MYLILDSTGRIMDICNSPSYARRQKNGIVIRCNRDAADAIYSDRTDSFWPIERNGYLCDGHTLVEVESVPVEVVAGFYFYHAGEFYTTETERINLAKSKASEVASLVFVKLAEAEQLDDVTMTEHAEQFSRWACPVEYKSKSICSYEGKLYRCLTAHTSQKDWTPEASASLWKEIGNPAEEWPVWSQPIGAVDAYALGDRVSHSNKRWISTTGNNVWEPSVYGWDEVKERSE